MGRPAGRVLWRLKTSSIMEKYVRVDWPLSQKWMSEAYEDEVEYGEDDYVVFVPEKLYNENRGYFQITAVHRDDLEASGFDVSEVSDDTMRSIAAKMCDDYVEQMFWISLKIIAEELGIPKKEEE